MEDFKRRKNYENEGDDDDEYMKKVNAVINEEIGKTKYNNLQAQLEEVSNSRDPGKQGLGSRLGKLVGVYGTFIAGVGIASFTYAPAVKFVKQTFGLTKRWHVHFAIIPFLGLSNAVSLGLISGVCKGYQLYEANPFLKNL